MSYGRNDAEAWRRYVAREQLVSAMNNTKWRETIEAMLNLPGGPPHYRIKDLLGDMPTHDRWDREWYYHPLPWRTIEWLEIEPLDRREEVVRILKVIGTPFSFEEGNIRIWGWLRPGEMPSFA
jgi:hypothetical protein